MLRSLLWLPRSPGAGGRNWLAEVSTQGFHVLTWDSSSWLAAACPMTNALPTAIVSRSPMSSTPTMPYAISGLFVHQRQWTIPAKSVFIINFLAEGDTGHSNACLDGARDNRRRARCCRSWQRPVPRPPPLRRGARDDHRQSALPAMETPGACRTEQVPCQHLAASSSSTSLKVYRRSHVWQHKDASRFEGLLSTSGTAV